MNTIVFPCVGQSNMVGEFPVTTQFAPSDTWMVGLDGFIRPLTEPPWDGTNYATGGVNHPAADATPGQSSLGAFADRLRALGETRRIIFVPAALGGASAAVWNLSLADNPPTYVHLYGAMQHATMEAMKAPGAVLGGVLVNQGEADSNTSSTLANAWDTTWGSTFDAFVAFATAQGWTWAKTIRFWVDALQVGSTSAFASNVRARQFAIASTRSDTHTIQEPDANPVNLHLQADKQIALGVMRANDWFAAA